MLLCDVSLHLERARNEVVLDSAELGPEDELSGLFEAAEFLLNGKLHPINLDSLLKVSVVGTKLAVVECDTCSLCPLLNPVFIGDDHTNASVFE